MLSAKELFRLTEIVSFDRTAVYGRAGIKNDSLFIFTLIYCLDQRGLFSAERRSSPSPTESIKCNLEILIVRVTMSEIAGITNVQILESEVASLEKKLELAKKAETTSVASTRIAGSITSSQAADGFLVTENSVPNQFHTAAAPGEGGCCVLS